jgi:NADH:ubiquinone oxidoreductase subunit 2 (subunit N)
MIVGLAILLPLFGAAISARRGRTAAIVALAVDLALALDGVVRDTTETLSLPDVTLTLGPVGFAIAAVAATGVLLGVVAAPDWSGTPAPGAWTTAMLSASVLVIAGAGQLVAGAIGLALIGVVGCRTSPDTRDRPDEVGRRLAIWLALAGAMLVLAGALGALGPGAGPRPPTMGLGGLISSLFVVGIAIGLGALPFFLWLPALAEHDPARAAAVVAAAGGATTALAFAQAGAAPWLFDPTSGRVGVAAIGGGAAALTGYAALGAKHPARAVACLFGAGSDLALAGFVLAPPGGSDAVGWMLVIQVLAAALALVALAGFGRWLSGGLWRRPLLGASLVVALLALVGLPPTAGFVARSLVAGAAERPAGFVVAATLASAIGGLAALRVIAPLVDRSGAPLERPGALDFAALSLAAVLLVLGIVPGPVLSVLGAGF